MRRCALAPLAASLVLLVGLTGCLGAAPPVPRDHYYRIAVSTPSRGQDVVFPGVVSVAPLEADGLLRERPLLFSPNGRAHEMQQHDYHYWTDPPPRMLQAELVDYLRHSGMAQSVITPELRIVPDYEVSGRIRRLERLLGAGPSRVVAELELAMTEAAHRRLLVIATYSAEAPARDDSVGASVLALNEALADIFARFLTDAGLRHTALHGPEGG